MPADIIPLRRPEPEQAHLAGTATCLHCQHKWPAVAPVGVEWLECPACGMEKGAFLGPCLPPVGEEWWTCGCGCHIFYMSRTATVCCRCGSAQNLG